MAATPEHGPYIATTYGIRVTVRPHYVAERSAPKEDRFFWAYEVEIANLGPEVVQLISRHWRITDAHGVTHDVEGLGVVGEQPVLDPGGRFRYTSGVPLTTPSGFMRGTYGMRREDGTSFDAEIPAFLLESPSERRVFH